VSAETAAEVATARVLARGALAAKKRVRERSLVRASSIRCKKLRRSSSSAGVADDVLAA
jgi:hypothetical protein